MTPLYLMTFSIRLKQENGIDLMEELRTKHGFVGGLLHCPVCDNVQPCVQNPDYPFAPDSPQDRIMRRCERWILDDDHPTCMGIMNWIGGQPD